PVCEFLRCRGYSEDQAKDHGHAFFAHLLSRGFPHVDPQRGRFRSYLLGAVKYFVKDLEARARRAKRGGGLHHEALEAAGELPSSERFLDPGLIDGTEVFDREWAVTLMNQALEDLSRTQAPER